jgi:hypothetical protein
MIPHLELGSESTSSPLDEADKVADSVISTDEIVPKLSD